MKRLIFLILLAGFLFTGCASMNSRPTVVYNKTSTPQQLPLLFAHFFNKNDLEIKVVLIRKKDGKSKAFGLGPNSDITQPLIEGGGYKFFVQATALKMVVEKEGEFFITPGSEKKVNLGGKTIIMKDIIIESFREYDWKEKPSRLFFGSGRNSGEVRYGATQDTIRFNNLPAHINATGGPALVIRVLTGR